MKSLLNKLSVGVLVYLLGIEVIGAVNVLAQPDRMPENFPHGEMRKGKDFEPDARKGHETRSRSRDDKQLKKDDGRFENRLNMNKSKDGKNKHDKPDL